MAKREFESPGDGRKQAVDKQGAAHAETAPGEHGTELICPHVKLVNVKQLKKLTEKQREQLVEILKADLKKYSKPKQERHPSAAGTTAEEPCEVEYMYCDDGSGNLVWCRCEKFCTSDGDYWRCEPASLAIKGQIQIPGVR